jgi:hypothetical protein
MGRDSHGDPLTRRVPYWYSVPIWYIPKFSRRNRTVTNTLTPDAFREGTARAKAVARALDGAPLSLRDVARRTGVTHVKLLRVTRGENIARPGLAEAVAGALDEVGRDCQRRAKRLRTAIKAQRRGKQ